MMNNLPTLFLTKHNLRLPPGQSLADNDLVDVNEKLFDVNCKERHNFVCSLNIPWQAPIQIKSSTEADVFADLFNGKIENGEGIF